MPAIHFPTFLLAFYDQFSIPYIEYISVKDDGALTAGMPLQMESMGKFLKRFNETYTGNISAIYNTDRLFYANLGMSPSFLIKVPAKEYTLLIRKDREDKDGLPVRIRFPNFLFFVTAGTVSIFGVNSFRFDPEMSLWPLSICNVDDTGKLCLGNVKYPSPTPDIGAYAKKLDDAFFLSLFTADRGGLVNGISFHALALEAHKKKVPLELNKFFKKMTTPIKLKTLCSIK